VFREPRHRQEETGGDEVHPGRRREAAMQEQEAEQNQG